MSEPLYDAGTALLPADDREKRDHTMTALSTPEQLPEWFAKDPLDPKPIKPLPNPSKKILETSFGGPTEIDIVAPIQIGGAKPNRVMEIGGGGNFPTADSAPIRIGNEERASLDLLLPRGERENYVLVPQAWVKPAHQAKTEGENSPEVKTTAKQRVLNIKGNEEPLPPGITATMSYTHMVATPEQAKAQEESHTIKALRKDLKELVALTPNVEDEEYQLHRLRIRRAEKALERALNPQLAEPKGQMLDKEAKVEAEGLLRLIRSMKTEVFRLMENSKIASTPEYRVDYLNDARDRTTQAGQHAIELFELLDQYKITLATEDEQEEASIGRAYMDAIYHFEPDQSWCECPSEVYKNVLDREFDYIELLKEAQEALEKKDKDQSKTDTKMEQVRKGILMAYAQGHTKGAGLLTLLASIDIVPIGEHELPAGKLADLTDNDKLELIAFSTWIREMGPKENWQAKADKPKDENPNPT